MKLKSLIVPAYLTAALLVIVPFGDSLLSIHPFRPSLVLWRFGAAGILTTSLLTPLLGLLLATGVAAASDHRKMLLSISTICVMASVCLMAALALFTLDAIQVRAQIDTAGQGGFTVAFFQAGIKQFLFAVLALWLAIGGFRTASRLKPKSEAPPFPARSRS
jgi:hypothetical protein